MGSCELCGGTLQRPHHPDAYKPDEFSPCPRCLSVLATDEIRAVSDVDYWWVHECPYTGVFTVAHPEWQFCGVRILPLYLGAGFDLGCRVLAARWGLPDGPWTVWLDSVNCLVFRDRYGDQIWEASPVVVPRGYMGGDVVIPALATIPNDAPPEIRAARALALALTA